MQRLNVSRTFRLLSYYIYCKKNGFDPGKAISPFMIFSMKNYVGTQRFLSRQSCRDISLILELLRSVVWENDIEVTQKFLKINNVIIKKNKIKSSGFYCIFKVSLNQNTLLYFYRKISNWGKINAAVCFNLKIAAMRNRDDSI